MGTLVIRGWKLPVAAVLITLVVSIGTAQGSLAGLGSASKCKWEILAGVQRDSFSQVRTQSGKVNIDLVQPLARLQRPDCNGFAALWLNTTASAKQFGDRAWRVGAINYWSNPNPDRPTKAATKSAAAGQAAPQQGSAEEARELAKKLSNPVAALISFPLQSNFDFGMGTGSGWRYTLNVQPVIPIRLNENWNLISRTILPIIHQGNVTGPGTSQSGLGDTIQSFFFSPNKSEPFIWAVGPVALIPTATNANLGSQKWGLGPTALILKQKSGWTYGMLANHIWSVAGKSNRSEVSSTFLQPFLSYTDKEAWTYAINTESTYDWVSNSWSVPIHPQVSKLVRFGKQPVSFGGGLRCWVTAPAGGPDKCGLRIVITALFPKK